MNTDDRSVVAWYDLKGEPNSEFFDFKKTRPGSNERCALVAEQDRFVEALKGQGCQVHVYDIYVWPNVSEAFYTGKYLTSRADDTCCCGARRADHGFSENHSFKSLDEHYNESDDVDSYGPNA